MIEIKSNVLIHCKCNLYILKQYVEVTIRELGNNNVNVNESEIVVPSMIKSKSNMSYVIYVTFGSPETLN